ncbi:MAG: 6,7-dimethyl-8-ribityllumazine synthase, partial [Gammaproteobacteria bacterium]
MSHKIIEGELQGANQKLAIVVGRFNSFIGDALLRGALDSLKRSSVKAENIT